MVKENFVIKFIMNFMGLSCKIMSSCALTLTNYIYIGKRTFVIYTPKFWVVDFFHNKLKFRV